jgi:hypothetical protein
MKQLDEETALAIVFANTRRKKRTENLLVIGRAFNFLKKLYGSVSQTASRVGLSEQMIREFLSVLKLPREVQVLVQKRLIDSVDTVYRISHLPHEEQLAAAMGTADLSSQDVRDIQRLSKTRKILVKTAKKRVLDAKPKGMHLFVVDFDEFAYGAILTEAKAQNIKPPELIKRIVLESLNVRGARKR